VLDGGNPASVSQNFDDLATTNSASNTTAVTWSNNTTLPGWYSNRPTYVASSGGANSAGLYSYGSLSTAKNDRALGSVASGSGAPVFGWRLKNTTGQSISSFTVTYDGEQWRQGGNTAAHSLTFDYVTGATLSVTSAATAAVPALDFTSPVVAASGTTVAVLDGNSASNRRAGITAVITLATALADQQEILLRWTDRNDDGNDHGLGIDNVVVSFTLASGSPTPSLTVAPGSLSGFGYIFGNGPSAVQSFTLEGSSLTAGSAVTVTAPASYQVAVENTSTAFGSSLIIANAAGGTLATAPIYVRLKAGLAVGTYNETVSVEGGGAAAARTVTVNGSVSEVPTLTVTPASLPAFSTTQGTASAAQTYRLDGANLTASVQVEAPEGYEVAQSATNSTSPNTYGASQTVTAANATAGRTIYVRLKNTAAAGTYGSSASPSFVNNTTTNATAKTVAVEGAVTAPMPVINASPGSLADFITQVGAASEAQFYTLTPTALSAPITVTAPGGFVVSLSASGPFGTAVEAPATGSTRVYVQLTGTAVGPVSGTITNVSGSAAQSVAVSGEVTPMPVPGQVVISQVYGGGGNSGAPINADFIELHNVTGSPVPISGWSVQYAGSTASVWEVQVIPANTTLAAGAYYLVRASSPGSNGSALPTPDLSANFLMSSSSAKVALVGNSTALSTACPTIGVLDLVGYGTAANCFEGSGPTANLGNSIAALRQNAGCLDTDDNAADFQLAAPNPRNSATPASICAPLPEMNVLLGGTNQPVGSTVTFGNTPANSTVSLTLTIQNRGTAALSLTGTPLVAISGMNAADFAITQPGSATVAAGSTEQFTVAFTPAATGARTATLSIANNDSDENPYTLTLTGAATTSLAASATGTLLLEENFNYPATDNLQVHGWTAHSMGTNAITVVNGNNALSGYPIGRVDTTTTRRVKLVQSGDDLHKRFTAPTAATTLYAATTVRLSAASTGDYFLHFYDADANALRSRVFARAATGGFQLGLAMLNGTPTYAAQVFELNKTYLLVLKYEVVTTGDVATLHALPVASATEPTSGLVSITGTDTYATLNAIALRQGNNSAATLTLDGVRVASGWGAAVGQLSFREPAASVAGGTYHSLTMQNNDVLTPVGAVTLEGVLTLSSGRINTDATNSLTLGPEAAVSSASTPGSYVNGPLRRIVTPVSTPTSFVFPLGKDGKARPAALSVATQASTTTYTAELFNQSARTSAVLAPLTRVSGMRYTTITPDAPPTGFSGTITLSFDADDQVTDPAAATLVVAKRSSNTGLWENIGRSASFGTAAGEGFVPGTITSDVFSSFSDFALASTDASLAVNPLPVTLVSFEAVAAQPHVRLSWKTATEQNNAGFEVQRSPDGQEFRVIGTVAGHGTTAQAHQYSYLDTTVPAGVLYYRLRQVDASGKSSYSAVRVVSGSATVSLYPNPARAIITLQLPAKVLGRYQVVNSLGQIVVQGSAQNGTTVPVAALPAGVYRVLVTTAAGRSAHTFIKE
jgi:trimeric autotransporter adhesin